MSAQGHWSAELWLEGLLGGRKASRLCLDSLPERVLTLAFTFATAPLARR